MNGRTNDLADMAIVGGGLAGGLIALALHRADPSRRLALIEAGEVLGGNHRWSWFASDLCPDGADLLAAFGQTVWQDGYEVAFPRHARHLSSGYRSLSSADFHQALTRILPPGAIRLGARAVAVEADGVTLASGERIAARAVIDCREFEPTPHLTGGWQVFLGRHLRLQRPHRCARPVIMDATPAQCAPAGNGAAYRFVYLLPLGEDEIFLEDTYYADSPAFDRALLRERVERYGAQRGWRQAQVLGEETGVLPVITGGDFSAYLESVRVPGVAVAGVRGGFTHPLTSYTVPIAVRNALAFAAKAHLPGTALAQWCEARARAHWRASGFYRALGRMLFMAAQPARRVDVFERFYRLPQGLIERFYACRSTLPDKARILTGKPPVPFTRAIRALAARGQPLIVERGS